MKVSCYVPCYNGAAWLAECLDALLAQTVAWHEVLVIDDGSTDQSAAIVRAIMLRAPRLRLVQHMHNRGLAAARNTALAQASGDILASVDTDVRASPTWLARLLDAFDAPRTAAVGGRLVEACTEHIADRWRMRHMAQHAGDQPLLNPPVLPGANTAIRRQVVRALGGYDEAWRTNYEDIDVQHRLVAAGYRCRYEPAALAFHLRTDTARSVLRTYWNWLRPPFERRRDFKNHAGLQRKLAANLDFARRALWRDVADGESSLAYLSLLVLLAFPAADAAHGAREAIERGDDVQAGQLALAAQGWTAGVAMALNHRSAHLAAHFSGDLTHLAWWERPTAAGAAETATQEHLATCSGVLKRAVETMPRAWWPALEASRDRVAHEEGWTDGPVAVPAAMLGRPAGALAGHTAVAKAPGTTQPSFPPAWEDPAAWLRQTAPDALSLIAHGAASCGEVLAGAPVEWLLVVRRPAHPVNLEAWQAGLSRRLDGDTVRLDALEAHRLGWMRPSLLQQSLLAGGIVLWGDAAALRAVPSWPPEQLDPRLALEEQRAAETALAAGHDALAVQRAAGGLLLVRHAYTPRFDERLPALRRIWPEAPVVADAGAAAFVWHSGRLIAEWLFHWEGSAAGLRVQEPYAALWRASTAAAAPGAPYYPPY